MEEIFEKMANALIAGKQDEVTKLTQEALDQKAVAKDILDNGLLAGMDVVGQRFLGVHVDTAFHGGQGSWEVCVIRRRDHDRIDLLVHLVEHYPVVVKEGLGGAPVLHVFGAVVAVHIAKGYGVFIFAALLIWLPSDPASGSNEGNIHSTVGRWARLAN